MREIQKLQEEAEENWRKDLERDYSIWSNTPVITDVQNYEGRNWQFYTKPQEKPAKIYAEINNDEALQLQFRDVVTEYWEGEPEELAEQTLEYLHWHEIGHHLEAPKSEEDRKKITQAMRDGIQESNPEISPSELYTKVSASRNTVTDFILDNRYHVENLEEEYTRTDIVPTWDLMELSKKDDPTQALSEGLGDLLQDQKPDQPDMYEITRYIYSTLYGPQEIYPFFEQHAGQEGVEKAEETLEQVLEEEIELPKNIEPENLTESNKKELDRKTNKYAKEVRQVFKGEDRYDAVKRMMEVLEPYITSDMPQSCPGHSHGGGNGGQDLLEDLTDDMDEEEQEEFLEDLEQELEGQDMGGSGEGDAGEGDTGGHQPNLEDLHLQTMHQHYKNNHPEIKIRANNKEGEIQTVGKRENYNLKSSQVITQDQLKQLNLDYIAKFQEKTGLPMLMPLENQTYRFNEYELVEEDIEDVVYKEQELHLPDKIELYLDNSGSMYDGRSVGFKDSSRRDMLNQVVYGYIDALRQAEEELGEKTEIQMHSFGSRTVESKPFTPEQFWNGDIGLLEDFFKPQTGKGTNLSIQKPGSGKDTDLVAVTDGDLSTSEDGEARKMQEVAQKDGNTSLLFEIGGTYSLGKKVRDIPEVHYRQAHNKQEMLEEGIEVTIQK